jgi:hypothetical protein
VPTSSLLRPTVSFGKYIYMAIPPLADPPF